MTTVTRDHHQVLVGVEPAHREDGGDVFTRRELQQVDERGAGGLRASSPERSYAPQPERAPLVGEERK